VGPKRKKALMKAFGSMRRLKEASVEQIAAVDGIPAAVAQSIFSGIHAWDNGDR
jgi:excinuclease ABC subunit C